MDLAQGFALSPSVQERLRLLDWIADNGGTSPGTFVRLAGLFEGLDHPAGIALAGSLDVLEAEGFLHLHKKMAWGSWSCTVTSGGLDHIESLRGRRGDPALRRKVVRDAFHRWLYDRTVRGVTGEATHAEFSGSKYGSFLGDPFTPAEINKATEWLKEEGYLNGVVYAGPGVLNPFITNKGEKVADAGRSVNDDSSADSRSNVTHVSVTGHGNTVAAHSPGAVQSATVTMTEDNRKLVLPVADNLDGLLRANLLGLDAGATEEAVQVVSDLRSAAAEPDINVGVLRQLLQKAQTVAIAGTGSMMGQGVVALAHQALQGLGLS